jgi:hypothetical protein
MIIWSEIVIGCLAVQVHGNLAFNSNKINQGEVDGII